MEKAKRLRELAARSPAPSDERDGLAVLKVQTPTTGLNAVFGKMPALPFPEDSPILEEQEATPMHEEVRRDWERFARKRAAVNPEATVEITALELLQLCIAASPTRRPLEDPEEKTNP